MVNYQLYRTNVLLGGQMKYDLILNPTQRGNETGIVDFHITPISKHVPYGKHIQEDLLNYSHNENIKKYYEKISSSFYKDFTSPLLTSNYPLPTGYKGEISETTYEMGCRRMTYSLYQKQHEFLCPIWLEKIDDINKLEFEFQVTVNSESTTPIYIRKVKFDSNPKLATYFNEYINMLGLKGNGEDWVFNISQNGCQANGLNVKTGLCSVVQLPNLFNNLSSRERPLLEFNNIIINKLNEKYLITKQLFNFNLCFNFNDIMNAYIYNELHMHPIYINVVVKYDGKALDMKDIFSNHEFINKPYLHLPELDFSNPDKIIVRSKPSEEPENLLDYLKDNKCIDLIDKNKITQNTCHWIYCSDSGSHFNFYDGFSSVFKSPSGKIIYIPSYNENVCDINYDGSNVTANNNITSVGYPYWCNNYNYIFPSQSGDDTTVRDIIYQNLKSLFENGSQSLWSTFTPGCIQKGIQYLGGDGCVDVLSLYTFPFSISVVVDELLAETNNLPKMQTAEKYISQSKSKNKDVDNILEVLEKGIKKYLKAKDLNGIADQLVVSESNIMATQIDGLKSDYAISLKDENDTSYKSSVFDGVFNFFNYQSKSTDEFNVAEDFKTQKTLLDLLVAVMTAMKQNNVKLNSIRALLDDLDHIDESLKGISNFVNNHQVIIQDIDYDIRNYSHLFRIYRSRFHAYKIYNFIAKANSMEGLKFFKQQFPYNTAMNMIFMNLIYTAIGDLKKAYQIEGKQDPYGDILTTSRLATPSFTNNPMGKQSVSEMLEILCPQLVNLNKFIQYLYDGYGDESSIVGKLGVDQRFKEFYSSLQEIQKKNKNGRLDAMDKAQTCAEQYQDYIAEKQQYIFGTYVDYLENKSMLTFGSVDEAVEKLNNILAPNEKLPASLEYKTYSSQTRDLLSDLIEFSSNSCPQTLKTPEELKQHCDGLIKYLYNDNSGQKSYGDYLSASYRDNTCANSYAMAINCLADLGSWGVTGRSTNQVIKCLLDTIQHFLNIITNKNCIDWGPVEDMSTGQQIQADFKTSMLVAYMNFLDCCKQAYSNSENHGLSKMQAKHDIVSDLYDKVQTLDSLLNDLQNKVNNTKFLNFLEIFFNFVETEYSRQNWSQTISKPTNSINMITASTSKTGPWSHNLMATAVTPYFIYLAWQQYWSGIQKFYKEKGGSDLDGSISNCQPLFREPYIWEIMISDKSQAVMANASPLINAANKFLSKSACAARKDICDLGSVESSTALLDEAIKKFQTDHSSIYKTQIGTIRVIYEKNKDVVTKVLFWNLFEKASQQSLPFSKAMLYPNIIKTMKDHSNIFGSIGEENNENTEAVEVKATATGLLSILNSANKEFQQLLPFRNGLTYKTANGPSLSVEEIDYYKTVLPRQVSVFRELGKIKPYFIDQQSTNENFVYSKKTVEDMGGDYKKYTLTNLPPKYPSIGYFALQHSPVAYQKVDDGAKNEYNLYISNKIINLEPEFDINYSTSDAISFDIHKYVEEYIKNKYNYVLGEKYTENNIKEITSKYKIEHTHIDSEIVDNEYRTVYKLKIKLK